MNPTLPSVPSASGPKPADSAAPAAPELSFGRSLRHVVWMSSAGIITRMFNLVRGILLARLRLRASGPARLLARVSVLGALLHKIAVRLVPPGTSVWAKIERGGAAGLWIQIDARSEADFRGGNREPAVQEGLKQWLAPDGVFYDIGANAGFFSLLASRLVGPSGKIYAFEAEPDAAERLRGAAKRNNLPQITIVEAAVWSKAGTVVFDQGFGSPDRMVGHVVEYSPQRDHVLLSVAAIALDGFVLTAPAPDVVKCDVEGAEVEVFRVALANAHVRVLTDDTLRLALRERNRQAHSKYFSWDAIAGRFAEVLLS